MYFLSHTNFLWVLESLAGPSILFHYLVYSCTCTTWSYLLMFYNVIFIYGRQSAFALFLIVDSWGKFFKLSTEHWQQVSGVETQNTAHDTAENDSKIFHLWPRPLFCCVDRARVTCASQLLVHITTLILKLFLYKITSAYFTRGIIIFHLFTFIYCILI